MQLAGGKAGEPRPDERARPLGHPVVHVGEGVGLAIQDQASAVSALSVRLNSAARCRSVFPA